jgi:hypothetical protein
VSLPTERSLEQRDPNDPAGALPLDAKKRQAHHRQVAITRVLETQIQSFTWP